MYIYEYKAYRKMCHMCGVLSDLKHWEHLKHHCFKNQKLPIYSYTIISSVHHIPFALSQILYLCWLCIYSDDYWFNLYIKYFVKCSHKKGRITKGC